MSAVTKLLDIDSAVMTNWKERGVPLRSAIEIEIKYGCSPAHIVTGKLPAKPPPTPTDLGSRPPPSPSDWALLDAISALPSNLKAEKEAELLAEGKKWAAYAEEVLKKARGGQ